MQRVWTKLCGMLQVEPRELAALCRVFLIIDFRQQHYASATGTKPNHIITPVFWVMGQCLTASAVLSLFLFARTDVFFFSFANLSLSLLVLASVIFVEFQEIVINPKDHAVIGHRPVSARTYSAARFLNLLFFVGLAFTALNIIPLFMGLGLRDARLAYMPAYFVASLGSSLILVAGLVILLSLGGQSRSFDRLKALLSWVQIILILVVGYGGQFMLRDSTYTVLMWGAFPPEWTKFLPTYWLAKYVTDACYSPTSRLLLQGSALLGIAGAVLGVAVVRLSQLYRRLDFASGQQASVRISRVRKSAIGLGVSGWTWILPTAEQRTGFWLCRTQWLRDMRLLLRCLLPFHLPLAIVVLGLLLDQWANPMTVRDPRRVLLSILSCYMFILAVPTVIYQLAFCDDNQGSWILLAAPLESPTGIVLGICKAVIMYFVLPGASVLGIVCFVAWSDWQSALLHFLLVVLFSWPAALAGVWLLLQSIPFSLEPARGGALGIPPGPLLAMSSVLLLMTTFHYHFSSHWLFWLTLLVLHVPLTIVLHRRAAKRVQQIWRPQ